MEITANALQTIAVNQDVLFTETAIGGSCSILHRPGSGIVTLRGLTQQCRARYKVSFGANVGIPDTSIIKQASLAIAINGEAIPASTMTVTPIEPTLFHNVFSSIFVDVPCGCCSQISVQNISDDDIDVKNANLIIERVA